MSSAPSQNVPGILPLTLRSHQKEQALALSHCIKKEISPDRIAREGPNQASEAGLRPQNTPSTTSCRKQAAQPLAGHFGAPHRGLHRSQCSDALREPPSQPPWLRLCPASAPQPDPCPPVPAHRIRGRSQKGVLSLTPWIEAVTETAAHRWSRSQAFMQKDCARAKPALSTSRRAAVTTVPRPGTERRVCCEQARAVVSEMTSLRSRERGKVRVIR